MVSPVLEEGAVSVDAYFPTGNWFDLFNYSNSVSAKSGTYFKLAAPRDHINVHVREGNIIAMQGGANTTKAARETPFELLVAVSSSETMSGQLFLDDGDEVEMGGDEGERWSLVRFYGAVSGDQRVVSVGGEVEKGEFALSEKWIIEKITFIGLKNGYDYELSTKIMNGVSPIVKARLENNAKFQVVEISRLKLPVGHEFSIQLKAHKKSLLRGEIIY